MTCTVFFFAFIFSRLDSLERDPDPLVLSPKTESICSFEPIFSTPDVFPVHIQIIL